ncbi:hypothetical protein HDV05_001441 [Chytridiales sp. JEL 0842]|nr:hypothetical protein HDV05_001441 [Chytridiales sp. JEL 0842]
MFVKKRSLPFNKSPTSISKRKNHPAEEGDDEATSPSNTPKKKIKRLPTLPTASSQAVKLEADDEINTVLFEPLKKNTLFGMINIYIIPTGIPLKKLSVMKDAIISRGGAVSAEVTDKTTHIVTALKTSSEIDRSLARYNIGDTPVLSTEFISDSIKSGRLGSSERYRVRIPDVEAEDALTEPLDDVDNTIPSHGLEESNATPSQSRSGGEYEGLSETDVSDAESLISISPTNHNGSQTQLTLADPSLSSFQCVAPIGSEHNLNAHITSEFDKLVKRAEAEGDQWRIISYRKAITILKRLDHKIRDAADAENIRGIGASMKKKIGEILRTGATRKSQNLPENYNLLLEFQQIYGVGDTIAKKFIAQGYRSREDLIKYAKLTKDQLLGLKYYDDFIKRIPREECTEIRHMVQETTAKIDPDIECIMMGSYRRGAATCGDVDFILTHPNGTGHEGLLPKVVERLKRCRLIIDDLTSPVGSSDGHQLYKGVCRYPVDGGTARRIDILVVPYNELGAALIYFTGNEVFNRSLRLLARKKGYSLNQRGLFANVIRNGRGEKIVIGPPVASRTEQEIFDVLGVPWRDPTERNV